MIPKLFNAVMDVLAERIEPNNESSENYGIKLFADDVQLTTNSRLALQQNLDTEFTWATETEMTWIVRKCSIIQPENEQVPLKMGTEPIQVVESEAYLGVTITRQDITHKLLRKRVREAWVRLGMLKRIGLNTKMFGPGLSRTINLTFICLMFDYCCHFVIIE